MITYYFDETNKTAKYEQLYNHIKLLIHNDTLKAYEKLPSKRQLATHLKISQITVESAYMQLKAEGYIQSVNKVGFFVEPTTFIRESPKNDINLTITKPVPKTYVYDLKTNVIDPLHFPYELWSKLEKEAFQDVNHSLLNSGDSFGYVGLRKQISDYLFQYRGIKADESQIVIGAGTEVLLQLLTFLLGTSCRYALETPGYPKLEKLYQAFGINPKLIELDEFGMIVSELERAQIDVVHVSPSHQFPTGIVMPITRRIQLLTWANQSLKRYIIEDDYDSEFRFAGNPIPALQGLDQFGKVIYLNSFSKSIAPTLRMSFMVLPQELLNRYLQSFGFLSCSVPIFDQIALSRFMESKAFEKHLNRMKIIYKNKRDLFIDLLKTSTFGHHVSFFGAEAGLHFIMKWDSIIEETMLIQKAKDNGVRIYGLHEFSKGRKTYPQLVIGYGNYQKDDFEQIVKRLELAWNDMIEAPGKN